MFVLLGARIGWFGTALTENRRTLEIAAGAFLIASALVIAGVPLPRILQTERRFGMEGRGGGLATSALAGVAFAIGWIPCIGPTLAAILTLALGGSSATEGAVLLAAYSIGLGVPFLLLGLLFTRART